MQLPKFILRPPCRKCLFNNHIKAPRCYCALAHFEHVKILFELPMQFKTSFKIKIGYWQQSSTFCVKTFSLPQAWQILSGIPRKVGNTFGSQG
jgi:hypothetical protein